MELVQKENFITSCSRGRIRRFSNELEESSLEMACGGTLAILAKITQQAPHFLVPQSLEDNHDVRTSEQDLPISLIGLPTAKKSISSPVCTSTGMSPYRSFSMKSGYVWLLDMPWQLRK